MEYVAQKLCVYSLSNKLLSNKLFAHCLNANNHLSQLPHSPNINLTIIFLGPYDTAWPRQIYSRTNVTDHFLHLFRFLTDVNRNTLFMIGSSLI